MTCPTPLMRFHYAKMCLQRLPRIAVAFLFSFRFAVNLTIRRLLFTATRQFNGPPITSPITGESIFNIQSLINAFAMQVVGELDGPWQNCIKETPAPVVFDVGSNIGQFGALVRSINPKARVYTWDCWAEMEHYVTKESHRCVALGSIPGTASMARAVGGWTASTQPGYYRESPRTVPVATLDKEWERLGQPKVKLLKIDVDGAEFSVLQGAAKMLTFTRFVIVETEYIERVKSLCPDREWTTANGFDYCGELL
jgi:FkbM family methyltransferase